MNGPLSNDLQGKNNIPRLLPLLCFPGVPSHLFFPMVYQTGQKYIINVRETISIVSFD